MSLTDLLRLFLRPELRPRVRPEVHLWSLLEALVPEGLGGRGPEGVELRAPQRVPGVPSPEVVSAVRAVRGEGGGRARRRPPVGERHGTADLGYFRVIFIHTANNRFNNRRCQDH